MNDNQLTLDTRNRTALLEARERQCRFLVSEDLKDAVCCGNPDHFRPFKLVRLSRPSRLRAPYEPAREGAESSVSASLSSDTTSVSRRRAGP